MSINSSFGLNLRVLSFQLSRSLVKDSDEIRVSITTIPEENKQAFTIPARKMKDCHLTFGVNVNIPQENIPDDFVSAATEKIVVVFRKKSFFFNDPIIASTSIHFKDLPKNLSEPAEIKSFNIYEPKCHQNKTNEKHHQFSDNNKSRPTIGRMEVQMSLTDPFHLKEFDNDQMFDLNNKSIYGDGDIVNENDQYKNNFFGFRMLNE